MSLTLRFNGPPSPGYADDGETWVDDLGYASDLAGRRVTSGEAVTLEGGGWSVIRPDPDQPGYQPDAILLESPDGDRLALPRTLWSADGEAAAVEKVADVLAWVGDDSHKARAYLTAEKARGDAARVTLVRELEKVIDAADEPTIDNAGAPDDTTPEA